VSVHKNAATSGREGSGKISIPSTPINTTRVETHPHPVFLMIRGRCQPPQPKDSSPNCLLAAKSVRTKHVPNMFSLLSLLRLTAPAPSVRLLQDCYSLALRPITGLRRCPSIVVTGNPAPITTITTPPGVHKTGSRTIRDHRKSTVFSVSLSRPAF